MKKSDGFLLTEFLVTIGALVAIFICVATLLSHIRQYAKYSLVRQNCIQAANAQLDSLATTGQKISDEKIKNLWDDIKTNIQITPGSGQWQRLKLAEAQATGKIGKRTVSIELARYIDQPKELK